MIIHRLRSLHILIHDEYRSTEKLSTGLRNVRLLVRPQLVSTAPVLWQWVSRAGRGAGREKPGRAPPRERGNFSRCTGLRRRSRVIYTQGRCLHLVRLELTFGTSGELLCLVAGQDINRI